VVKLQLALLQRVEQLQQVGLSQLALLQRVEQLQQVGL
jgi:hypothetical protein